MRRPIASAVAVVALLGASAACGSKSSDSKYPDTTVITACAISQDGGTYVDVEVHNTTDGERKVYIEALLRDPGDGDRTYAQPNTSANILAGETRTVTLTWLRRPTSGHAPKCTLSVVHSYPIP